MNRLAHMAGSQSEYRVRDLILHVNIDWLWNNVLQPKWQRIHLIPLGNRTNL